MTRRIAELINESVGAAEKQLSAARSLDLRALGAATARRQDLLFQLGLEEIDVAMLDDPKVRDGIRAIERVDRRLVRVLNAGLGAVRQVLPQGPPPVYAPNGRMRGRA